MSNLNERRVKQFSKSPHADKCDVGAELFCEGCEYEREFVLMELRSYIVYAMGELEKENGTPQANGATALLICMLQDFDIVKL